jgi:hypothetical protein
MEVFEHLPLHLTEEYLRHVRASGAALFLTIPSSGVDPFGGLANFLESDARRLADLDTGSFFRYVTVDEDPRIGGGHIMLAGYGWWEDFFHLRGFVRDAGPEARLAGFADILTAYRWCPYALRSLEPGDVAPGPGACITHAGVEFDGQLVLRTTTPGDAGRQLALTVTGPGPNHHVPDHVTLLLFAIEESGDHQIKERLVSSSTVLLEGGTATLAVDLPDAPTALRAVVLAPSSPAGARHRVDRAELSRR